MGVAGPSIAGGPDHALGRRVTGPPLARPRPKVEARYRARLSRKVAAHPGVEESRVGWDEG